MQQKSNNDLFKELFTKYDLVFDKEDKKNSDIFITKNFKIITRTGVDKIQARLGIYATYDVVYVDPFEVMMKGTFTSQTGAVIQTFASASVDRPQVSIIKQTRMKDGVVITQEEAVTSVLKGGNVRQSDPYLIEMAEKRCMARGVLKLAGLYQEGFYSEDEADVFSKEVRNEMRG